MESQESKHDQVAIVAREMGDALRRDVSSQAGRVRVSERNEGSRHVWRFRADERSPERFLHIGHGSMTAGENASAKLLAQLKKAEWSERLFGGSVTSLMLSPQGQLKPWPKQ